MLTKLDAINQLLDSIGEDSVASLEAVNVEDVAAAIRTFDRVDRSVQAKGWHRNTETGVELQRDGNGRVLLPQDALRIDASEKHQHLDVVPKKLNGFLYLYDRGNQTFEFKTNPVVDIVRFLDFESLTPELQFYITAKACCHYYEDSLDSSPSQSLKMREMEAYAALLDAEAEVDDANILRDSPSVRFISHRVNNRLSGV